MNPNRQPAGTPDGGQFAAGTRAEAAGVALTPPVRALDGAVTHAHDVMRVMRGNLAEAEHELAEAARETMTAGDAAARAYPTAEQSTAAAERLTDAMAREAAAREVVQDAQHRLDRAQQEWTAAKSRYPYATDGTPTIELHAGVQRPVSVAPSGRYGFYEMPHHDFLGDGRSVAIAQNIRGTWHPTGATYDEATIRDLNPTWGLAIDAGQGWAIDPVDAHEFVAFAHQEALP